jgi:hypothetical protein
MKRLILGSMLILTTGLGAAVVKRKLIKDVRQVITAALEAIA